MRQADSRYLVPGGGGAAAAIQLIYHYNLLCDPRLGPLTRAIGELVTPDSVVCELGAGTGILALLAARIARHVYAVDLDRNLLEIGRAAARRAGLEDRITFLREDAAIVELPERCDLLISEMIDTALIREPQVPILNRARGRILKAGGDVIPRRLETALELVEHDYDFCGLRFPLPFFETGEVRAAGPSLTPRAVFHRVDFREDNSENVEARLDLDVTRDGYVTAIRLTSETELTPDHWIGGSDWFNAPLVVPVPERQVTAGESVVLSLAYTLGAGIGKMEFRWED